LVNRVVIDVDELKSKFRYEPDTGSLYSSRTGKRVGGKQGNYLMAWVSTHKRIFVHRIAWALTHSYWPDEIDHINGVTTDNRIINLRVATRKLQSQNTEISSNNTTGVIGVCPCKQTGRFKAVIVEDGKQRWLGRFDTIDEAAKVRRAAEIELDWSVRGLGSYSN